MRTQRIERVPRISRVLSLQPNAAGIVIHLGHVLPHELERLPGVHGVSHSGWIVRSKRLPFTLHRRGFAWTIDVTADPVSSYLTFSP